MQKRVLYYCCLLLLSLCCSAAVKAQDAEAQIKQYMDKIQYWRYEYSPEDSGVNPNASPKDSVLATNKMLTAYLQKIGTDAGMLRTTFKTLDEAGMKIVTSDDKKLRIYSWDTETGDETHIYNAVAQFESGGGTKTKELNGYLYTDMFTAGGAKKYYLAVYSAVTPKEATKGLQAFSVDGGQLNNADILQSEKGLGHDISYSYDYTYSYDYKAMKEKYVMYMSKGSLYIPVPEGDKLNGKWQVYSFDGNKFVTTK